MPFNWSLPVELEENHETLSLYRHSLTRLKIDLINQNFCHVFCSKQLLHSEGHLKETKRVKRKSLKPFLDSHFLSNFCFPDLH